MVVDPRPGSGQGRRGRVLATYRNPACEMRVLLVLWDDGDREEVEETVFSPLTD